MASLFLRAVIPVRKKNGYVLDILWLTKPKNITYFG